MKSTSTLLESRSLELTPEGYHPFQVETLQWVATSHAGSLLVVDAPVGAGKSRVIEDLIISSDHKPVVVTYPTKILIDSQCKALQTVASERGTSLQILPREAPKSNRVNLVEYSGTSLLELAKSENLSRYSTRGELLGELFGKLALFSSENADSRGKRLVTTPDVLHLIAQQKYNHSRDIELFLKNGLFIFDEFHLYQDLKHFYNLLNIIFKRWEGRVILMSATPLWEQSFFRDIYEEFNGTLISATAEGDKTSQKSRCFNFELNCHIHDGFQTNRLKEEANLIRTILRDATGPVAFICDSLFRLRHLVRILQNELIHAGWNLMEWSGERKQNPASLRENTLVVGTAAIEVGVTFRFKTLIMEASHWASAVQRLGRAGRLEPATVHIITRRTFHGLLDGHEKMERSDFEQQVLKQVFTVRDKEPILAGEMFRGDSYPFALYDCKTGEVYFGDEGLFSRYHVNPNDTISSWRPASITEKEDFLNELRIPSEWHQEILLRDQVFPLWSVLKGYLRDSYENITPVYSKRRGSLTITPLRLEFCDHE